LKTKQVMTARFRWCLHRRWATTGAVRKRSRNGKRL